MKICFSQKSFFIIFLIIQLISSMHWETDTQLRDLEYNGVEFVAEASHWYCSSLIRLDNKTYNCNGVYYLGGYNIMAVNQNNYFQRSYYTLPAHNQVRINMTFFAMDNWEYNDFLDLKIDGNFISGFTPGTTDPSMSSYSTAVCGAAGKDYPPFNISFTYPHTSTSSITVQVIANMNALSSDESLSFRNFIIEFQTVTTPTSSQCAVSSKPLYSTMPACPCPLPNQYQNPAHSGTCSFCDKTCETCSGSAATQCLTCYPFTDRYYSSNQCLPCYTGCATCTGGGQYQCTSCKTNYYLANDGACYNSCDFPLYVLGDTGSVPLLPDRCLSPCLSLPSAPYLYWDGTCSATCAFPLIQTTKNSYTACTYPCTESQYLYWNQSCLATCPYPLTTRVQNHRYFCDFPCYDINTDDFLLWDASCSTDCALSNTNLIEATEGGVGYLRKFCRFPCPPSQYLYWNGSCIDTCPFPLTSRIQNGRLFCDFTCTTTTNFLYWNGSCITSCLPPLTQRTEGTSPRHYCDYSCGVSTDYLYWNGTCSTCLPPLKTRIDNDNKFCDYPCATTEWLYWDGTCQPSTSCNPPLVKDVQGTPPLRNFCQYYCGINQYLYWNGSCIDRCEFPLTRRYTNFRQFCDYPCAPTQYLYWNGSCLSSCVTPLTAILEGTPLRMYCEYPCSNNQYLYWNTTCGSCNTPFVRRTEAKKNYCDYPCPTSEWLYWDGSCNTTCAFPLTQVVQGNPSRMLCAYTCGLDQYLYWNGTCADDCVFPLLSGTFNGRNFCYYPCLINQYLYPNRTCASSCTGNFPPRTEANRNYCDYPCSASQFLLYTGICVDKCPSPYVVNIYSGNQFCDLPCVASYYWLTDKKVCNETCNIPLYYVDQNLPYQRCIPSEIILSRGNLIEAPTKPETVTFLTLVRPMNYMRYLEISMPERLELLAASRGRNILATYFGLEIPSATNLSFFKEKLPYVYARHNVQASFLVSYWKDLITLLIGIGAAFLFFIIEKVSYSEGWELIELISKRFRVILMWNYVIMIFAWKIDDLILFAALEYMTIAKQPETPVTTPLSFLMSLFFLALMLGFIYGAFRIIKTRRHLLKIDPNFKKSEYAKQFDLKYENYQIVYRGFKDNSVFNQFFFLIYMLRIGLPMVIAVSAIDNPLVVAIFQLIINIDILLYLLIMKPFKKLINQIQLVSYEIIIFMMNICVLVLAAKSPTGADSPSSIRLGDVIIIGNDMINFLVIIFLVIKVYIEALAIHKDMKRLKKVSTKEKVTAYLQLLALPIQQDNMGFEEMINYYCPPPKPWFEPLVKRLFRMTMASIGSFFGGLYSDCIGLFGNKNAAIVPIHHQKLNNNDPGDLHTYDYEHKMFNRDLQISRPDQDETMNAEVRLINKSVSIMDLTPGYERGNHLDKFVDDEPISVEHTPPQIEPEPYLQRPKNPAPVPPSSLQQNDMSAIGGKGVLDNSGLSLEPFLLPPFISPQGKKTPQLGDRGRPVVKLESPQFEDRNNGLDSESVSDVKNAQINTTNISNIRKKRGKVNHVDLQIDAELAEATYNHPKSGIPDNLSPIAKSGEPHQLGPISNNQASGKHKANQNTQGIIQQETEFVTKDYKNYEWNKESNETETAFNLDDSFEKNKKKATQRKKKIRTDFKLSGSPQEDNNKNRDYVGWTPYNGN